MIAAAAHAAPTFSQILTPSERAATGFTHLTPQQAAALNALIERDIESARQGGVTGFAKTFTQRRTADERQRAGIDQLTDTERAQLDRLVASVLASRPVIPYVESRSATQPSGAVTLDQPKPEVHGQVSAFYGQSSGGGSWYGGSFDAVMIDPSGKYAIGIGMSEVRTHGLRGCVTGPVW